jgi:hypothetical protein
METYKERLQKRKENTMTNYDMDEIERQKERERRSRGIRSEDEIEREKDRNSFASVKIGEPKKATTEVEIELSDDDLLVLTLAAHDRDITLNQLCNSVLADSLKNLDYRFEHQTKPQVLKEY